MKFSLKTIITPLLLCVWLLLIAFTFAVVNRIGFVQLFLPPTYSEFLAHLARLDFAKYFLDIVIALLGTSFFSLACTSLGLRVLHRLVRQQPEMLPFGVTAFLTGEILFSLIFLSVISIYGLSPFFAATVLLLGFFLGLPMLREFYVQWTYPGWIKDFDRGEKIIFGLVVWVFVSGLFLSSARLGYDSTAEYFSQPKIMALSQSAVYFYPKNTIVVSAFHPGILVTALIQLFGDQSARMLSWFNGLAILLLGLAIGEKAGLSRRGHLSFLVLMVTSTAFVDLLGDGKVELISTAPILAAIYWMLHNRTNLSKDVFILIGLMAGFSIISRPYNIFLVSFFIFLYYLSELIHEIRTKKGNFRIRFWEFSPVFWIIPVVVLLGVFHLWQNWLWLGSPLAPLNYAKETDASVWAWQFDPKILNMLRLFYPLTVTVFNTPQSLGNISPFFIGLLPFLILPRVRNGLIFSPFLRQLVLAAFIVICVWIVFFFTVVEIRYVFFLWVIFFLFASVLIDKLIYVLDGPFLSIIIVSLIGLSVYMGFRTWIISIASYSPIDKNGDAHCFDLNICTFFTSINQTADPGDRVFVLHAYRYYLRSDLFACSSLAEDYLMLEPLARQSPSDFWIELYRLGYRYIVFEEHLSKFRYMFGELPSLETAPDWLIVERVSKSSNAPNVVYHLIAVSPPVLREKVCQKNEAGVWQVVPFDVTTGN